MVYKRKRSFRRKSFRKSRRGKYSRKTRFASRVKGVLLRTAETKKYQFADENVQLNHNAGVAAASATPSLAQPFNIWAAISKGTSSFNRIGDRIIPRGMSLKIWLANKLDRPNLMYRIIIAKVPKAINAVATTQNNVDPFDALQLGNTGNRIILNLDRDRGIKALYDKVFTINAGYNASSVGTNLVPSPNNVAREAHLYKKLWIKSKNSKPIIFDSTTSSQIVNNPLMVWVIAYDSYGTLTSDTVASLSYYGVCYFKDI